MAAKFVLKVGKNGQFFFNLKAANGQVILTSEMYKGKDSALNGIESVRKNAASKDRFERKATTKNEPFFVLSATNGQTVGKSETYSSAAAMENGIGSVMENAPKAELEDLTEAKE